MSYGHKDWWVGVAPEKSIFGELQVAFTETKALQIVGGGESELISYEVPAGYMLNVTGFVLGSDTSGIVRWDIKVEGAFKALGHFDTFANIILGPGGEIVVDAAETMVVNIYNLTGYTSWFTAYVYGFLQQILV